MLTQKRICAIVCCISIVFLSIVFVSSEKLLVENTSAALTSGPVIVLDAGHGDFDGGATGVNGASEKDLNLSIALKLQEMLTLMGYNVVMTRDSDTAMQDADADTIREKKVSDMKNRLALVEQYDDCVLVSIHQNKFEQSKYSGTQSFYSITHPDSKVIAESVQRAVIEMLQPENNRVVKPIGSDSYLMANTTAAAVLIECGFLSNAQEEANLMNGEYQNKLVFCIVYGLIESGCI